MSDIPKLTEDEFYGIDDLEGWSYVEWTEDRKDKHWGYLMTRVYTHHGRFFSVAVARTLTGEPVDTIGGTIVEVYPRVQKMTVYKSAPEPDTAALYDAIGVNKVGAIGILRALNDAGATLGDVVEDLGEELLAAQR